MAVSYSRVDDLALAMVNAVRTKKGSEPVTHITKIAEEAVPYWKVKAEAAITYVNSLVKGDE